MSNNSINESDTKQGSSSVFSAEPPIFGRQDEGAAFKHVLVSAGDMGLTVLTVGQVGMGKTTLLRKFEQVADSASELECTVRHFILREQDDPDTFLDTMVHETFGMVRTADGRSRLAGPNWKKQVAALFGIVNADKLFESLLGEEWNPSWQKLLDLFIQLSGRMSANRRIIFIVDPSKYLHPESASAWLTIAERLPPKFVLVFAQRLDDVLARYPDFRGPKIHRIPDDLLRELDPTATEAFIKAGLEELSTDRLAASDALRRYGGWPYAIQAGLLLLKRGVSPGELPADPDGLAERLLDRLSASPVAERGFGLVYALAVLEVAVPMPVLADFLEETVPNIRAVLGDTAVAGIIHKGKGGYELFHSLFADRVQAQVKEDDEWVRLHEKAVGLFEGYLLQNSRDEMALRRLPFHVREAHGLPRYFETVEQLFEQKRTLGMLVDAIRDLEDALRVVEEPKRKAAFSSNLGVLYGTRGDLEAAERMQRTALAINEEIGHKLGMAKAYGNLGILHRTRGDLEAAEEMFQKTLAISGELELKENMATAYGHMGTLHRDRGDFEGAEAMFLKALAIDQELGRKEGVASQYGSLGVLHTMRGDLEAAEAMLQKALSIHEDLGYKVGMASDYGNLGIIYKKQGNLDAAEVMYQRALTINEELESKLGMAAQYGNLGNVYRDRGDFDTAEAMYKKALVIEEGLGHKVGMASDYGNLGILYSARADLDTAEAMYKKALAIEEGLGHKVGIATAYSNLGLLYKTRGDLEAAEAMWRKSLVLYQELGILSKVEKIEGWLLELEKDRG